MDSTPQFVFQTNKFLPNRNRLLLTQSNPNRHFRPRMRNASVGANEKKLEPKNFIAESVKFSTLSVLDRAG